MKRNYLEVEDLLTVSDASFTFGFIAQPKQKKKSVAVTESKIKVILLA